MNSSVPKLLTAVRSWAGATHAAPECWQRGDATIVVFSTPRPTRKVNQDAALVLPLPEDRVVLAVADGMGGSRAGARAAIVAIEELQAALTSTRSVASWRERILDAFERANQRVRALRVGAGSTLVVALVEQHSVRFFHAGDSQALLVGQRGALKNLTVSHSPVGYAVAAGAIDRDEALHHPALHLVSNGLGSADLYVESTVPLPLAARDTLLLASDGLFDNLYTGEIVERMRRGPAPTCARALAQLAASRMRERWDDAPSKPDDLTFILYRPRRPGSSSTQLQGSSVKRPV